MKSTNCSRLWLIHQYLIRVYLAWWLKRNRSLNSSSTVKSSNSNHSKTSVLDFAIAYLCMSILYNIQYVHVIRESRYCMGNSNKKQRENTVIYIVLALLDFISSPFEKCSSRKGVFYLFYSMHSF